MRESERQKLMVLMQSGKSDEEILEAMKPKRNGNGHHIPKGGISIREAARKYGIHYSTLSRWAKRGWVKVLLRELNWLYIDEKSLQKAINKYRGNN